MLKSKVPGFERQRQLQCSYVSPFGFAAVADGGIGILLENIFVGTKRANISLVYLERTHLKIFMGQKEQIFIWVTPLKIFWYKKRKYIFGSPAENPFKDIFKETRANINLVYLKRPHGSCLRGCVSTW